MSKSEKFGRVMPDVNLLIVSLIAIVSVFSLLIVLAAIIKLITIIFPEKMEEEVEKDDAIYASIYTTYAINFPNMRITKIEELL